MAKHQSKLVLNPSRDIPLDRLELSQSNVRRIKAGVSIEALAADIARRGLLHGLNVRPILDETGEETGRYEIPAGGRRYRALALLVKRKLLAKDAPIPCVVRAANDDILAEDDSYAENAMREALHPLDQFRAMQAMVDKGDDVEAIAAHHFVTPAVVRQRLKLAGVSPKLHDAYADDEISLEQLMAFTIFHLPMVNPVFAAKAVATIDHVSRGRGGINMVMGWYKEEMGMFGLAPHKQEDRYAYATEWLDIVRRLWSEEEPFDYKGEFFDLKNLVSAPKPIQASPPLVSAATSADGIAFASRHADVTFARSDDRERLKAHGITLRETAAAAGNPDVGMASLALVVCRETEEEARRHHQLLRDNADLVAARRLAMSSGIPVDKIPEEKQDAALRDIAMSAGSDALIGTPEQIADKIAGFHDAGVDALFLGFHDYLEEMPFFAEKVLPLLEQRGLRQHSGRSPPA
ncbi:MAG: hypothetical protein A2885_05720 [Sphingopyxis sp. RIFCSPHIGHO2_01_FULL_65_24]|nr:MAG: hypothetical protein A2885_05720 [Sphingopyxis sp. RIFCSPHIGHO2_01_FULL_65_24]